MLFQRGDVSCLKNCLAEQMHFSSDLIVMGLPRKVNMLTSYLIEFVRTCFNNTML